MGDMEEKLLVLFAALPKSSQMWLVAKALELVESVQASSSLVTEERILH